MRQETFTLRRLTAADVPAAVALERVVFPEEAWSQTAVMEEISSPWGRYLGAFAGDQMVAYGGVKGDVEGDLMTLAVLPGWRRQGLGRRLCAALLQAAREAGMESLLLEVRVSNEAARILYEDLGFEEVGRIPGYYRHPTEDAALMKAELMPTAC